MDIITHLCCVSIYSIPPFFPHLKCFDRFYYLRQVLFNKQKQHLTMAISSTDSTPTKRKKSKRQI